MPTALFTFGTDRSRRTFGAPRDAAQALAWAHASASVRHRVHEEIHADCVASNGELEEVLAAVALALERIAEVSVVADEHHDATVIVEDGAGVRCGAVRAALRRAPRLRPEPDRRNLRKAVDRHQLAEHRMVQRHDHGGERSRLERL